MPEGPKNYESTIEQPPDFARFKGMLLELQDDMKKLQEIVETAKDKPAMIFATRIADIPKSESLARYNKNLTDDIEMLSQGQITKDKKQFAGEFVAYYTQSFLRADAILQTYVLPAIDPPSTDVQNLANGIHGLIEHLKRGMRESLGVVFDDVQLLATAQPDSEDYKGNSKEPDRWVFFVQCYKDYSPEVRQMIVKLYQNIRKELAPADPILEQARQEGKVGKLNLDQYWKVTDVLMWGYTQDGLRELQTEVVTHLGTNSLDHNTRQPE